MKKKILISALGLLMGFGVITTTPILLTSCSASHNNTYKSIWEINGSKYLYVDNHNLGNNINDIKVTDSQNNEIPYDKKDSIIDENQICIHIDSSIQDTNDIKIQNVLTNNMITITNDNRKTFEKYNLIQDQKYFFELLKDMNNNQMPTIGYMRNASLTIQQAFYIMLTNYFDNVNNLDTKDKSFMFVREEAWDQERFNKDELVTKGIWNGNEKLDTIKDPNSYSLFNMYKDIDNKIHFSLNWLSKYVNQILKNTNQQFFDFFYDDLEFINNLENFNSSFFEYLFRYANRIIILSDGAYHANTAIPKLEEMLKNHNPKTREETINLLNKFRLGEIKHLTKDDVLDIILLKKYELTKPDSKFDYVSFINYDSNIFNSLNLNDNQRFHDSAFSTNFVDYQNCITDYEQRQEYLDTYSKLFINNNLTTKEVFSNGFENYDPKKPNAIFIGSSLFKPFSGPVTPENYSRLTSMPSVLNEVQQTINSFFEKYNPNEYNIIFKLHPVFSNADDPENVAAKKYVKLISGIDNPIIINSSIPLETLISYDYYRYKYPDSTGNYQSIIFREDNFRKPYEWTTFFGLQATTTTIHTTRLFYQTAFELDIETVANLIPFSNFPIPRLFPVVDRLTGDNPTYNYYDENLLTIQNLYKLFCPSVQYKEMNNKNLIDYNSVILNF